MNVCECVIVYAAWHIYFVNNEWNEWKIGESEEKKNNNNSLHLYEMRPKFRVIFSYEPFAEQWPKTTPNVVAEKHNWQPVLSEGCAVSGSAVDFLLQLSACVCVCARMWMCAEIYRELNALGSQWVAA